MAEYAIIPRRLLSDEVVLVLPMLTQSVLLRLYAVCDRYGRVPADEMALRARLAVMDGTVLRPHIEVLGEAGLVALYEVNGRRYAELTGYDEDHTAEMLRKRGKAEFPEAPQGRPKGAQRMPKGQPKAAAPAPQGQRTGAEGAEHERPKGAEWAGQGQHRYAQAPPCQAFDDAAAAPQWQSNAAHTAPQAPANSGAAAPQGHSRAATTAELGQTKGALTAPQGQPQPEPEPEPEPCPPAGGAARAYERPHEPVAADADPGAGAPAPLVDAFQPSPDPLPPPVWPSPEHRAAGQRFLARLYETQTTRGAIPERMVADVAKAHAAVFVAAVAARLQSPDGWRVRNPLRWLETECDMQAREPRRQGPPARAKPVPTPPEYLPSAMSPEEHLRMLQEGFDLAKVPERWRNEIPHRWPPEVQAAAFIPPDPSEVLL